MNNITAASKIYIDTNIFIYLIERVEPFYEQVSALFAAISEAGARLFTSEITVAECLHKPCRSQNTQLIAIYELLFEKSSDVTLLTLNGNVAKRAVAYGAPLGLKLIDAIHVVSALDGGCDVFVSTDKKFKSTAAMRVINLQAG